VGEVGDLAVGVVLQGGVDSCCVVRLPVACSKSVNYVRNDYVYENLPLAPASLTEAKADAGYCVYCGCDLVK
jgi:hypothetical protein